MKKIKLNKIEPEVLPAEPVVVPETAPEKPRPSEDDPFAVPAPKVDPTPKAKIMLKVRRIKSLEVFTSMITEHPNIAHFSKEKTLSDDILTKALALSAVITIEATDRSVPLDKRKKELGEFEKI